MSIQSLFSLAGKTALVAGASRGIGLAIAREIAACGAHTILASRSLEKLEAEAASLRASGHSAEAHVLDMERPDSIAALAAAVGPRVDLLINVAGTNLRKPMQDYTREEYDRMLQTNLHGIFELTQQVGRAMIARGTGGRIVNIGSLTSLLGLPYLSVYSISKSGLAGLTRTLAAEWGRYNIQVNCIAPGFIITDLNRAMWQKPEMLNWLRGAQGNPNPGTPADIAGLAVFLCAPASAYISGQVIAIDGGFSTGPVWPFEPA